MSFLPNWLEKSKTTVMTGYLTFISFIILHGIKISAFVFLFISKSGAVHVCLRNNNDLSTEGKHTKASSIQIKRGYALFSSRGYTIKLPHYDYT